MTKQVKSRLKGRFEYLTIGVDLNNTCKKYSPETHAELVAVVDAESGDVIRWTGKSYPTDDQARTLVQAPLKSHYVSLNGDQILVLGCHDLQMFVNRGRRGDPDNPTVKQKRRGDFLKLACKKRPSIVLHHPHKTYSPKIWSSAWGGLKKEIKRTKCVASGIAFCGKPDCEEKWRCYQTLDATLAATKEGDVVDVVVEGYECPVEAKWKEWAARSCA